MEDLNLFFQLGWQHIISIDAADHLLFLSALMALYRFNDWKKVLVLVTAFTIGHSITLLLALYNLININSSLVEFLIPLTIVVTAISNIIVGSTDNQKGIVYRYATVLCFGWIHGMGFATTLKFMMAEGETIVLPLIGFNLGVEAGQALVVLIILVIGQFALMWHHITPLLWNRVVSTLTGIIALLLCIERWPI